MRASSLRKRPIRRESGNYWLSFSDMMSVLVLVFIFVIFSMLLSLDRQKEQLEKTEDQYAEAMARIELSEKALSEKEGLLADSEAQLQVLTEELEGKTVILAERETELSEKEEQLAFLTNELEDKTLILVKREQELADQAEQIESQRSEMENALIILNGEKEALDSELKQANEALERLANSAEELEESKVRIIDLTRQLTDARSALSKLQGDYETQRQQIVILGEQNSALLTDAGKAQEALDEAEAENARLSQRISMLNGNAESKQSEIDRLLKLIEDKQAELDALGVDYANLLSFSRETQSALESAESVLKTQNEQLNEQSGQLTEYEDALAGYRAELARTQGQLEQMVGVKAQIVQSLSNALRANSVDVSVDDQTGAIRLPSEMLFAQDSNALSNEGKRYLDRFLPVYMSVLLSDEFRPYIAEIIIEGHTDSRGSYIYNLGLSQARALSVAEYVLEDRYIRDTLRLADGNANALRALITASGRSFSAPILNFAGEEDQDASRRVEIKFRLKDDDTVALTEALLELIGNE